MPDILRKQFANREALIVHVKSLCSWAEGDASPIVGGHAAAERQLAAITPHTYGQSRNFGAGSVTRLSPYIRHGIFSLNEVRNDVLSSVDESYQSTRLIQELAWRDYWQRLRAARPNWIWSDVEPYKTGFTAADYADDLPDDIASGSTGVACIDEFIRELTSNGYLHNHARLYVAAYVVHFRRVKWQAGARWFLHHLLDGDPASNNFSWQWVASTLSDKPYIFNLENVATFFAGLVDTSPDANVPLHASYEDLRERLFPAMGSHS